MLPTEAICKQILGEFDAGMEMLNIAKAGVISQVTGFVDDIESAIYTPINDLENAIGSIFDQMESMVPNFETPGFIQDIVDLFEACTNLQTNYSDPSEILNDITGSLFDGADEIIESVFDAVPELGLANKLDDLLNMGVALDLQSLIPGMDGILNCLSTACGSDVGERIDAMEDLLGSMKIRPDGNFDVDEMMSGITEDAKAGIQNVKDTVSNVKGNITASVTAGKDKLYDAVSGADDAIQGVSGQVKGEYTKITSTLSGAAKKFGLK